MPNKSISNKLHPVYGFCQPPPPLKIPSVKDLYTLSESLIAEVHALRRENKELSKRLTSAEAKLRNHQFDIDFAKEGIEDLTAKVFPSSRPTTPLGSPNPLHRYYPGSPVHHPFPKKEGPPVSKIFAPSEDISSDDSTVTYDPNNN